MAWFSLRRRAKPKPAYRFEQADPVVVKVFADLQQARSLKYNPVSGDISTAVEQFERQAWDRLLNYLVELPLLPTDDQLR